MEQSKALPAISLLLSAQGGSFPDAGVHREEAARYRLVLAAVELRVFLGPVFLQVGDRRNRQLVDRGGRIAGDLDVVGLGDLRRRRWDNGLRPAAGREHNGERDQHQTFSSYGRTLAINGCARDEYLRNVCQRHKPV
ncbi:hypothetical protein [Mycolicibacterium sarraceniae]|uniref:hypothetical protein n=1 Tax=Mycolicibacterium sarraceniae TaxID=1534348 RepID=UPI001F3F9408|nr:hypothetical protein [Mycolicibacterium sarraceniae]